MKYLLITIVLCSNFFSLAQTHFFDGAWQGIIIQQGKQTKQGKAIWFEFNSINSQLKGESRVETPFTEFYALKTITGKIIDNKTITFEDVRFGNKKNSGRAYWCLINGELTYNDSTGYLSGNYSSSSCRGYNGKIILYRSKYKMSKTDSVSLYHSWLNTFINDLSRGWPAYYVRDEQMKNFEFHPVYFDHDKAILKQEYNTYLKDMVKIVNSHTDLRIKIIGHTNSIGSDAYNIALSERRANAVRNYLLSLGLRQDQVVIEYRGERDPAVSNATLEGKKLNRRVDFEFI